jgi:uncharacterized membrane protein YfcA
VDHWTVCWFMFPVCIIVASLAMFSGISGSALLMPVFLIGFPVLGVPTLTTVAAVGMSLFLETSGFGTGVYRYVHRGLVDRETAMRLVRAGVPAAVVGSIAARWVPAHGLRVGYGIAMVGLSALLFRQPEAEDQSHLTSRDVDAATSPTGRRVVTRDGDTYRYRPEGLRGQALLTGLGATVAGLISTGVGEATLPGLVRRSGVPVPVAAATSTVVVAATVAAAAVTHLVELAREGGIAAIP